MHRDQYEAELIQIARSAAPKGYPRAHAQVLHNVSHDPRYAHISRARAIALLNYGVATREDA